MKNKKLAAAMAAVHMYIRTEEEAALAIMQSRAGVKPLAPPPVGQMNLWGISGRQAIMNGNAMIRQRMLK